MIDNKQYLQLKQNVLLKLSQYSKNNTNILFMLNQESKSDSVLHFLLQSFFNEDNDVLRLKYTEKILMQLMNANQLNNDLFGNYISSRRLFVLDILNELNFISFSLNNIASVDSDDMKCFTISDYSFQLKIAEKIHDEFEDLTFNTFSKLMHQFFGNIAVSSDKKVHDISSVINTFETALLKYKDGGKQIILDALSAFNNYNLININNIVPFESEENENVCPEERLMNKLNYLYS